jgi:hypothetical protein
MGKGLAKSFTSTAANTSTANPLAPNITSATAAPAYKLDSLNSAFGFAGTIQLPGSGAPYAHFQAIRVDVGRGRDQASVLVSVPATGTSVDYSVGTFVQTASATNGWQLDFTCINEDGVETPGPFHISGVNVQGSFVTAVAISENTGARSIDPANLATRLVTSQADMVVTLNGNQVPQLVTHWLSFDNGATFQGDAWYRIDAPGQVIPVRRLTPGQNQTWKSYVMTGAHPYQFPPIPASSLPAGGFTSAGFTVQGLALPSATAVTTAVIPAGDGSAAPYNAFRSDGTQYVNIPGWSWTDPTDINAAFMRFTFKCTDATGIAAPANQGGTEVILNGPNDPMGDVVQAGSVRTTDGLEFDYNPLGSIFTYGEFRMYLQSRNSTSTADWNDPTKSVLQTHAWGGAAFSRVNFGALPAGRIPGLRVVSIPAPTTGSLAFVCPISDGIVNPQGQITYCWNGTITTPSSDPTCVGYEITVQYAVDSSGTTFHAEGGAFCTLRDGITTWHNGDWARPATDIPMKFRAYPISRDNVRGTPAIYTTTLTAGGTYGAAGFPTSQVLTADASITPPAARDGAVWICKIAQDSVGGHIPTFGSGVVGAPVIDPTNLSDPNTMCVMMFCSMDGKWYLTGSLLGVKAE